MPESPIAVAVSVGQALPPANSRPIAVAMSGGVDSSTVAAMLVRDGRTVVGMTMQLWNQRRLPELASAEGGAPSGSGRCCSLDDVYDARRVAEQIGIPYYVVNFERQFEEHVVKPFVEEYLAGRTPIPCTLCNNYIKFDRFLEMADSVGAHYMATGHYARVRLDPASGRYQLLRAVDESKDQTYFLFGLTQAQLARTLFRSANCISPKCATSRAPCVSPWPPRAIARRSASSPTATTRPSWMPTSRKRVSPWSARRARFVTTEGRTLGHHEGVHHFTVGQRKGLGIATGEPLYVIATDPATQRVTVGGNDDLQCSRFVAKQVNWISIAGLAPEPPSGPRSRSANKHAAAPATLSGTADADRVEVRFLHPQRAITPGQGAVFYDGEITLGGGWIE